MRAPSYLKLYREGKLQDRIDRAAELMKDCSLCPRECHVDRLSGELGFCRTGEKARVASLHAHFGEESPLVGTGGSGTVFFRSCNLLCYFCQNYDISHDAGGGEVEPKDLADMMLSLQKRGCHNINFVTPSHVVPQILQGLFIAVERGLKVPLVYNTGGYDKVETLKILEDVFDIYMPDFKFWEARWSEKFCKAPDYRKIAAAAIKEMHRQVGDLLIDASGIAEKGLLVRHLVMPNDVSNTKEVMTFLADKISEDTYVNVMDQYHPCGKATLDPAINRRLTRKEYVEAVRQARKAGLHRLDSCH
ncbi:MAG: radical SAM protein [Syntrophales bacterium]|jgi:putative pyruvate formate lyase activating enzyme